MRYRLHGLQVSDVWETSKGITDFLKELSVDRGQGLGHGCSWESLSAGSKE